MIGVWGLAFKPNTDDRREAPSVTLIDELLERNARVRCFDPVAVGAARKKFGARAGLEFCGSSLDAVDGADALVVVTEWQEFRSPDFTALKARLKTPAVFDGRNLYDPAVMKSLGLEYYPIGRKT